MNVFNDGHGVTAIIGSVLLQTTVVIVFVWLLTATLARSNAAARHNLWLIALIYLPLSPLVACVIDSSAALQVSLPVLAESSPPTTPAIRDGQPAVTTVPLSTDDARRNRLATAESPASDDPVEDSIDDDVKGSAHPRDAQVTSQIQPIPIDQPADVATTASTSSSEPVWTVGHWILVVWLVGIFVGLWRLVTGLQGVKLLRRSLVPLDDAVWQNALRDACGVVGLKHTPRLAVSSRLSVPAALGPRSPVIVLPSGLAESLILAEARDLLIHECAHLRRRDHWVGIFQRMVAILFWPHPLVPMMNHRLDQAREEVCDNFVLNGGRPACYAATLLKVSERCGIVPRELGAVGLLGRRGGLESRMLHILDQNRNTATGLRVGVAFGFALAIVGVGGLCAAIRVTRADSKSSTPNADNRVGAVATTARRDKNGDPLPAGALFRIGRLHLRPGDSVRGVACSPDGRLIASAGRNGLQLWDAKRGTLVRELKGHNRTAQSVAFSPDGKRLVSGGEDWTARIWNVETGEQLHLLRTSRFGHLGIVNGIRVAFASNEVAVTGEHNGVVQVWSAKTGKVLRRFQPEGVPAPRFGAPDKHWISAIAVSPDGNLIAAAGFDRKIRLWDIEANSLRETLTVKMSWVRDLKFAPDGATLAWCGTSRSRKTPSGGIVLWDLKAGKIQQRLPGHEAERTYCVSFSPDGRKLASVGYGNTVKLWDLRAGKKDAVWTATGHTGIPWAVAFSRDGRSVVSGSRDGSLRIWNAATGKEQLTNPTGHWGKPIGVSLTPAGTILIGSGDRSIRVLDLKTGRQRRAFSVGKSGMERVAFSQDGKLAAVGVNGKVQLWDVDAGTNRWSKSVFKKRSDAFMFRAYECRHLSFSPNGRLLISTAADRRDSGRDKTIVRIWDVKTGRLLQQLNRPHRVTSDPSVSTNNKTVTVTEYSFDVRAKRLIDPAIRTFDVATGKRLREKIGTGLFASGSVLSPDGKLRAVGTSRSRVRFLNAKTSKLEFTLQGTHSGASLNVMAFSPDGKWLAAASSRYRAGATYVWEIATGRLAFEFSHAAESVRFTADGKRLLTSHRDGTMLVWDLSSPIPGTRKGLTREQVAQAWKQLGYGYDSSRGNAGNYARNHALVVGGEVTVAFLEQQLLDPTLEKRDNDLARRLSKGLASRDAMTRAASRREILKFGDHAYLAMGPDDGRPASPKVVSGVEAMLRRSLDYRRNSHGALDVLRQIGTLQARRLLGKIAKAPGHRNRQLMAGYHLKELKELKLRQPEE